ncbi:TIGR00269 family protein [Pyrofollis japonicus]|uniref:TIGR00269 family protein n=1 Tax=Pyrofollis japonicus TaxID=3060460 RepID=UPI00295A61A7|nr:TIGR00269 family protein [Pyrofollis japonicus]BEP18249.1 TIGR00269 family protein [Pyrofollis japonicus]
MSQRVAVNRKCSKCDRQAIVEIKYARLRLCEEHFKEFIESKVERILRKTNALRKGTIIVAAVSGGKDSATMLATLSKIAKQYGVTVVGVHIILGLREYSEKSLSKVTNLCKELGVSCITVDLKELIGFTVYELARRSRRPVCSICGLVKRYMLNAIGVEIGADYIALGHNADDIIAYSIKSFLSHDIEALAKFGPSTPSIDGIAVGRLRPLYEVYEKEALLYALVSKLPVVIEECPFRPERPIEDRIKEFMNKLEEEHPGIKLSFIRRLEKRLEFYKRIAGDEPVGKCKYCGLISAGSECSFCRLTRRIAGKPLGPVVREKIRKILTDQGLIRSQ